MVTALVLALCRPPPRWGLHGGLCLHASPLHHWYKWAMELSSWPLGWNMTRAPPTLGQPPESSAGHRGSLGYNLPNHPVLLLASHPRAKLNLNIPGYRIQSLCTQHSSVWTPAGLGNSLDTQPPPPAGGSSVFLYLGCIYPSQSLSPARLVDYFFKKKYGLLGTCKEMYRDVLRPASPSVTIL